MKFHPYVIPITILMLFPNLVLAGESTTARVACTATDREVANSPIEPIYLNLLLEDNEYQIPEGLTSKKSFFDDAMSISSYTENQGTYLIGDATIKFQTPNVAENEPKGDSQLLDEAADESAQNEEECDEHLLDEATDETTESDAELGGESLNQAASDPTAFLLSVRLENLYTINFHKLSEEDANTLVLRPVIPFKTGNLDHILRITAPIITHNPALDSGLSDLTIFDLIVFNAPWGRWGVGPVALIPTGGSNRGEEKWAIGPAIGFVVPKGKFLWGLFNQNLFSFAGESDRTDVNISTLQPILNYDLGDGWSIGNSEMTFVYDWEAGRFSSLPLGIEVGKLVRFGTQPVQFRLQYEYNFADDEIGPENTLRLTAIFLFP